MELTESKRFDARRVLASLLHHIFSSRKVGMRYINTLLVLSLMVPVLHGNPLQATTYAVTDIALDPGVYGEVAAINDSGTFVGTIAVNGAVRAFRWDSDSGITNLDPVAGYSDSYGLSINNNDQVVGYSIVDHYRQRATLWGRNGVASDLGALQSPDSYESSSAEAINDSGQVAGWSVAAQGWEHAFSWNAVDGIEDISQSPGACNVRAEGINDDGIVVGRKGNYACLWDASGTMIDVGDHTRYSGAIDINSSGSVLGRYFSGTAVQQSFVWRQDSGIVMLGVLPGVHSYTAACDINNHGQVVGCSSLMPFVWDSVNGIAPLPVLPGSSYAIAAGINENGTIVGYSKDTSGISHLLMWTPVPEPSSFLALGIPLVGLWAALRKRK